MDMLAIRGGKPLQGSIVISGAKNAALPEMCAALLTDQDVHLYNVPRLRDVATMRVLLEAMGVRVTTHGERGGLSLQATSPLKAEAPYELVKTMRASILTLGPLLARQGHARVSLPGGCAIGARPVEQHIKGLQAMGAVIELQGGYIVASLPPGQRRLRGAHITTDMITVTGTENLLMAATLAEGTTVLENAAQEPEVTDLAEMLIQMGARIEGHGSSRITIEGVERLGGCRHRVVADRIECGTFLCAVAATGGDVLLRQGRADHLDAVIDKLVAAGVQVQGTEEGVHVSSPGPAWQHLRAQSLRTTEYPGFPTDMQAQFMALNAVSPGSSLVTETIFENRFMHVSELVRLGANITVDGKNAMVEGVPQLSAARVMATDLRASAGLVIAALVAEGESVIERIYHLDRGYDQVEQKLQALGADVSRIS